MNTPTRAASYNRFRPLRFRREYQIALSPWIGADFSSSLQLAEQDLPNRLEPLRRLVGIKPALAKLWEHQQAPVVNIGTARQRRAALPLGYLCEKVR